MLTRLLQSLGISGELSQHMDQAQWAWARPWVWWVGLALLIPVAWLIARRQKRNLPHISRRMRAALTMCRVAVLLLLLFVLSGPYLRLQEQVTRKPVLAVVLDESGSMTLPAGPFAAAEQRPLAEAAGLMKAGDTGGLSPEIRKKLDGMTRLTLAQAVWSHAPTQALSQRFDVKTYRVARQAREAAITDSNVPAIEIDDLAETDLSAALSRAIDDAAGKKLAGIVLLTDGRWTTGSEPPHVVNPTGDDPSSALAPVWAVPVGGSQPPVDVAVIDVIGPNHVSRGDIATIAATIESQGLDGRPATVRLLDDAGNPLDTKTLPLRGAERQVVQLEYEAHESGSHPLTVDVTPLPEELTAANNMMTVTVDVDIQQLRLLYLEGSPRWDFCFLDHELRRDKGVAATVVVENQAMEGVSPDADTQPTETGLPQDVAGWKQYRAVMLGDVSPGLLTARAQEQLALAVEEGGLGLIVQAGPRHMPHDFADMPLARVLPARWPRREATGETGGILAPPYAPYQMTVTAEGSIHPVFRLFDQASRNRQIWSRMPAFFWAMTPGTVQPGASVLAEFEDHRENGVKESRLPLVLSQFAGKGRVLLVGMDSTFLWRRNIGSHLFYRFWGQAIRYVGDLQLRADANSSWLEVYPRRAEPGEAVQLELYAVDEEGKPLTDAAVMIGVSRADRTETVTAENVGQPGHYRGRWMAGDAGVVKLVYTDAQGRAVSATLLVRGTTRELRQPAVDRDMLARLGNVTGGGMLELPQLHELPGKLVGQPQTITRQQEDEIWDNWLVLVLLVGLYCVDVGVRRVLGLT
ncbi:MAG: hypothetical protein IT440_09685 [Phycisphaeraceae bacterium]|nr:hypothetical protein [Phycisphaeraceae bacterium]